jgi:ComF family protein
MVGISKIKIFVSRCLVSVLKQLLFTPKCLICSRLGVEFCATCINVVKPFRARDLSEFEACYCASEYSGWLRDAIICYKNGDARYTEMLSQILLATYKKFLVSENLTLIPIPSSQQKLTDRGFDSVANLCASLARDKRSIQFDYTNLFLRRCVEDQVGLSAAERHANLEGAFGVRRALHGTVLLVDDVVTTGATLNSAARALKFAGAQRIFALALCGTPKTR